MGLDGRMAQLCTLTLDNACRCVHNRGMSTHRQPITFCEAYNIWLTWPTDGHAPWSSFIAYLTEQTGREVSPAASARLRRYVRKTAGGTRGF